MMARRPRHPRRRGSRGKPEQPPIEPHDRKQNHNAFRGREGRDRDRRRRLPYDKRRQEDPGANQETNNKNSTARPIRKEGNQQSDLYPDFSNHIKHNNVEAPTTEEGWKRKSRGS